MATIKNVLLRGCRGRLGEYVIYQCRGKTCIRSRGNYENVAFTPEQKAQQERFASTAMLYRAAKAVGLEKYWRSAAENTTLSGYNLFMRYNLPAFTGEGLVVTTCWFILYYHYYYYYYYYQQLRINHIF